MKQIKKIGLWCILLFACIQISGCGDGQTSWKSEDHEISSELTYEKSMDLDYATEFAVDYYENGFTLISISDGSRFLLNTEGEQVPEDLEKGITVLNAPVSNIYLVASATMDMFCSIGALDHICLSGLPEEKWEIPEAKAAMESGQIVYAGKYNAPDYELICSKECGLAIESTMIGHSPEVKENLESFGIPVLVDHSSYESDPLGRTEWVKLYGVLTGNEDAAVSAFEEQKQYVQELSDVETTGKTVAFFYVTTAGTVSVRKSNDYVPKMIDIAGGGYVFRNLKGKITQLPVSICRWKNFMRRQKMRTILSITARSTAILLPLMICWRKTVFLQILKQSRMEMYGVSGKIFIRIPWIPEALSMIFMRC